MQLKIQEALGSDLPQGPIVQTSEDAELPSHFAVSELANESFDAAATELAALVGAKDVRLDRRLASLWFKGSIDPIDWQMPPTWDDIAGVYETNDGWIRLHTNAPHHRKTALDVLGCDANKQAAIEAVSAWSADHLETEINAHHGAAAAMRSLEAWASHQQGQAVAREPLIAWDIAGSDARSKALDEIKVLDLTRVLAGPVATRFLAGFGARVLRIDPPWWNEPGVEPEVTLGKRRAGLDLKSKDDRNTFEMLLADADVLVHGYRPGALSNLGYDPETLRRWAPNLIDVSLCAYGWTGPWNTRRGFDSLVQMSCGIAHEGMVRQGAKEPVPLPVQALDHATGNLMAAAVIRALRRRNATGEVLRARLSLARTACVLTDEGAHTLKGEMPAPEDGEFEVETEQTSWGTARRLRFPVKIGGLGPKWDRPSGYLRLDPPIW
ncbi:MAG: CoA transferase [Pseudomonadota bacterium]